MSGIRLAVLAAVIGGLSLPVSAMVIVVNPDSGLSSNPAAMAAFNRAANAWASKFSNNITINIDGGLNGNFSIPGVIGSTSSVQLPAGYNFFLGKIKVSAAAEVDDGIVSSIPDLSHLSLALPSGFTFTNNFLATKANFKALGYMDLINLDTVYGATDATITFNSNVSFDYDNSNGVSAGQIDFETVAAHEIGHALGFVSAVDFIDNMKHNTQTGSISIMPLDLFRFQNNVAGKDPLTAADFGTFSRFMDTGSSAVLDDISTEYAMSTGRYFGDGMEASHWKDDALTSSRIGIMDPSLNAGITESITDADIRALDLIGYNYIPEPAVLSYSIFGLLITRRRSRRVSPKN